MDPTRKLYRSKTNRKLVGVCGGLAQYFNIDVTLIRVLFVLLGLEVVPALVEVEVAVPHLSPARW